MKYLFLVLATFFLVSSCVDKQGENLVEIAKKIESEPLNEKSEIETITDFKKIAKLKKQIKLEQELAERARLDNLPLALRLIESDTAVFETINKLLTSRNFEEIGFFIDQFIRYKPAIFQINNQQIKDNILNLISDTIIERKVMKIAGILDLDYEEVFINRYKSGQEKLKSKYFYWIGKKGQNMEVLEDVYEKIKSNEITKMQQEDIIFGLRQFSNSENNEIKQKAISAAVIALKNNIVTEEEISSLKENNYENEKAKSFLKMMLENGGSKSKPIHNICLDQDLFVINVFKNLVSAKDQKAKSILLKQLSIREKYLETLLAVPEVYGMERDSTILIETLQILEKHELKNTDVAQKMNYILSKINCRNYLKNAKRYIKNEELIEELKSQYEKPEPSPNTYEDIVVELFKLHVTDSIDFKTLKHVKENEVFQGTNGLIKTVLHYNSQVVTLDRWATSKPIEYDFLLNGIKNKIGKDMSNLIFKSEFNNNKYSIIMIGKDKALFVHPQNNNQEIDAELLIQAVNEILKDKKLLVLKDDPDFIEIFYGSQLELNKIKGLLQPEEQGDLQI